jgi:hypothetical protein
MLAASRHPLFATFASTRDAAALGGVEFITGEMGRRAAALML